MLRSRGRHAQIRRCLYGTASAAVISIASSAHASGQDAKTALDIPAEPLSSALKSVSVATDNQVLFSEDLVAGRMAPALKGQYSVAEALAILVKDTNLHIAQSRQHVFLVEADSKPVRVAANTTAAAAQAGVETVVVTAQKKSENIQQVPIAVSAFSQQQLTEQQIAGGPDLVKEVPNLTFSKTNFSGYNLQIRGIGTQAVSVTTDPAVAVAFNGTPFIRNHFFEQEFFDLADAEVLRGPQGTLYGRNATAGVVNIKSALPTDQFEAMASVDVGNYNERRLEGMLNLPIVGDTLDIRFAGEWTKRDGYSFDQETNQSVDGRDLWSGRMTIGWKPTTDLQAYLVWEHFSEDDDRLRSGKQLCTTDNPPSVVNGPAGSQTPSPYNADFLSQGCSPGSLYGPSAFETPNAGANPFIAALEMFGFIPLGANPYAGVTQSQNLRVIDSLLMPSYRAKNDTVELNANYKIDSDLTLTSQTGFNSDFLYSTEDYDRFNSAPGIFVDRGIGLVGQDGEFCDPQLGCSNRLVGEDVSEEHAQQFSQEFRLTSDYSGPLNFSVGANYLYYRTVEDYYVFYNGITLFDEFMNASFGGMPLGGDVPHAPFSAEFANSCGPLPANLGNTNSSRFYGLGCSYVDPNPLGQINGQGHNYFLSQNPYRLDSYAGFGEVYYQMAPDLKLTGGLRWTDDIKSFTEIPSWTLDAGEGYPIEGDVDQSWREWTGRFNASWTPTLDFTDQSLFYGSYSRGYKGGGANPPGVIPLFQEGTSFNSAGATTHPLTFKPEFVDAFELGTKNTLLDGAMTLNGDIFYYKYQDYQISQIVDRTSVNLNFNATVQGAELESTWEPLPGLRFNFSGGYENAPLAKGSQAIDLMDRTAGNPDWMVVKPFITQTSNCILPTAVVNEMLARGLVSMEYACLYAYSYDWDPVTLSSYVANPVGYPGYVGFNPTAAPNGGEGFYKNLSGNQLPNTPPFTLSFGSQYSIPVSADWAATLRGDFYWQGNTFARVFNDKPYDSIHGYTNLNVALIFADEDGWQAMAYVKNVFDTTAITGAFLNSDDSGLTTNVFLNDPRLFGVRITKDFGAADTRGSDHGDPLDLADILDISDSDGGKPPLWIELGGQYSLLDESQQRYAPPFLSPTAAIPYPSTLPSPLPAQQLPGASYDWNGKLAFEPDESDWVFSVAVRYGRSSGSGHVQKSLSPAHFKTTRFNTPSAVHFARGADYVNSKSYEQETHAVLDFMVGKDVGLGMFGGAGTSILSGGVRVAQFSSGLMASINADPDYKWSLYGTKSHDIFNGVAQAKRSFHGIGPAISWDASTPVAGNAHNGEITLDWGVNAAVLFGRRTANIHHQTTRCHRTNQYYPCSGVTSSGAAVNAVSKTGGNFKRSRTATVPNLGGFVGMSMRYTNAKISFGYRADEFFGAMDTGLASEKTSNMGFFGPFANISIGLGG